MACKMMDLFILVLLLGTSFGSFDGIESESTFNAIFDSLLNGVLDTFENRHISTSRTNVPCKEPKDAVLSLFFKGIAGEGDASTNTAGNKVSKDEQKPHDLNTLDVKEPAQPQQESNFYGDLEKFINQGMGGNSEQQDPSTSDLKQTAQPKDVSNFFSELQTLLNQDKAEEPPKELNRSVTKENVQPKQELNFYGDLDTFLEQVQTAVPFVTSRPYVPQQKNNAKEGKNEEQCTDELRARAGLTCGPNEKCVLKANCKKILEDFYGENLINFRSALSTTSCPNQQICCHLNDIITLEAPCQSGKCGFRHANGMGLSTSMTNTNQAKFGEFPWMVALMKITRRMGRESAMYIGGGALIAPNIVLTANHIVTNETLLARAGEWHIRFSNETYEHQDRFVDTIIHHESYNIYNYFNNIAILILKIPFSLEPHINPICLPSSAQQPLQDERCFMSGWGKLNPGDASYQPILKKLSLPIVLHSKCDSMLRNTSLGSSFRLHQSFLCAGGEEGSDACTGDGGSPLVCPIVGTPNRYYLAGIVAMGLECGKKDVPGLYANVTYLRNWIDEKLKTHQVQFTYFTI